VQDFLEQVGNCEYDEDEEEWEEWTVADLEWTVYIAKAHAVDKENALRVFQSEIMKRWGWYCNRREAREFCWVLLVRSNRFFLVSIITYGVRFHKPCNRAGTQEKDMSVSCFVPWAAMVLARSCPFYASKGYIRKRRKNEDNGEDSDGSFSSSSSSSSSQW
jgi:hypothetical protein